jgi:nitroreductase
MVALAGRRAMQFEEIVVGRHSVKNYDPNHAITDGELRAIFENVVLTPSSFNLQHWRFVVVRDPQAKAKLRKAAFNQEQVEAASAVIVVVGKLNAYEDAPAIYADTPKKMRDMILPMIRGAYAKNPHAQREEAVRSASLAAMTLMYAAYDMGYATGPMIGFDPEAVSELVGLDEHHFPVMLVVIGKQLGEPHPRAQRFPVSEVVRLESLTGPGLV